MGSLGVLSHASLFYTLILSTISHRPSFSHEGKHPGLHWLLAVVCASSSQWVLVWNTAQNTPGLSNGRSALQRTRNVQKTQSVPEHKHSCFHIHYTRFLDRATQRMGTPQTRERQELSSRHSTVLSLPWCFSCLLHACPCSRALCTLECQHSPVTAADKGNSFTQAFA